MAFCHSEKNLVTNMVKKIIDTAIKTGIDAAKTSSKRLVPKTGAPTGDLIVNKIADKITSERVKNKELQKRVITKREEKEDGRQVIHIPPEKKTVNY